MLIIGTLLYFSSFSVHIVKNGGSQLICYVYDNDDNVSTDSFISSFWNSGQFVIIQTGSGLNNLRLLVLYYQFTFLHKPSRINGSNCKTILTGTSKEYNSLT